MAAINSHLMSCRLAWSRELETPSEPVKTHRRSSPLIVIWRVSKVGFTIQPQFVPHMADFSIT
jgi:hypothetical protein